MKNIELKGGIKMKKIILSLLMISVLLVSVGMVVAMPKKVSSYDPGAKNSGPAGKSSVSHLYLVQKDSGNWSIVPDGAWGKMTFSDNSFVFNGHGLVVDTGYTLIYYGNEDNNNVWPYATCLAEGTSNAGGNVHLAEDMIIALDDAIDEKIWLVLSSDVNCEAGKMITWHPTEYLFEYNLI
ncbi:MAG: hypothetical protein ABIA78_01405 [archaeon]